MQIHPYRLTSLFLSCLGWWCFCFLLLFPSDVTAQTSTPRFKILALAEAGSIHRPFVDAAKIWLQKQSADNSYSVDYIENTEKIDDAFLSQYRVFIQLNYPPYGWTPKAVAAFTRYIEEGRGGWIGFHHATLLGEFDGFGIWPWFSQFMGGIRFTDYIAEFATATVIVEDPSHPLMKNVGPSFVVEKEEWYTYDKSPRPNGSRSCTRGRSDLFAGHSQEDGRSSSDLDQREGQGAQRVHLHGPSSGAFSEFVIHYHFSQCHPVGGASVNVRRLLFLLVLVSQVLIPVFAQQSGFKVLAFYSATGEPDHVQFAQDALKFLNERAASEHFTFESTTKWEELNDARLKTYPAGPLAQRFAREPGTTACF